MKGVRKLIARIRVAGVRRRTAVTVTAMGRARTFDAYDIGPDTYIFERGIARALNGRPSVLIVAKGDLRARAHGWVMTMTSGNHAVAAFPLLDGRFWKLSALKGPRRGETLTHRILCANVVDGKIEISQREVATDVLVAGDGWLLGGAGLGLGDVVMGERNDVTLDHYRRLGQEWRVKPLAWTAAEMKVALAAARKRIGAKVAYFHSAKGVHFLTYPEFVRFVALAETAPDEFLRVLREFVAVFEGNATSFMRMPKHRGHHEIELFGIKRGVAQETVVPALERILEGLSLARLDVAAAARAARAAQELFASLLSRPELGDETSGAFVETLYMYITGEIYAVAGEGTTPAFDDRRTALPGATFVQGRAVLHPGADARSEVLLSNVRAMLSKGEVVEYANVYEIRGRDNVPVGCGATREIVYKTNMRPLETSLVEKGLSSKRRGYGDFVLARVGALRAMGVALSSYYKLLKRRPGARGGSDFYVRTRCEGETLETVPAHYYRNADCAAAEETGVVCGLATLMGDAAAQNMAMKKFDPVSASPLYGVGKEIYEFEYDILRELVVPKRVATCSIRGSFGWPCLDMTEENLQKIGAFYFLHFAHALKDFQRRHTVPMRELAERFMSGFEFRTHAMAWQLSVMRDQFEAFHPPVDAHYGFERKWRFVMWALERQERRLPLARKLFFEKVRVVEDEDVRNNPE